MFSKLQLLFSSLLCDALRIDLGTLQHAINQSEGPLKQSEWSASDLQDPSVAVLEHRTSWGGSILSTIKQNLDIYESQAEKAARLGVKLLVTPEYGVTGFLGSSRSEWSEAAADIPEISDEQLIPCAMYRKNKNLEQVPGLFALWRLSCIARKYKLALVASLVDLKDCEDGSTHPDCAHTWDGLLLFNTNVVFDSDGSFVLKYHKTNMWGEHAMDVPHRCQVPMFTLQDFSVTFGMFTCADIIHSWPALHLVSMGVRHFVMPLAWSNEMSQMQPLAWLQSWSRINNVVLLAANARDPYKESGSGIFSGGNIIRHVYGIARSKGDSLLVAPLPQLPSIDDSREVCPGPARQGYPMLSRPMEKSQWKYSWMDMSSGVHTVSLCSSLSEKMCCVLSYHTLDEGHEGFGYVLAVLDGEDGADGILPWSAQACAVLPCTSEQEDCMEYPTEELLDNLQKFPSFSSLDLQGTIADEARIFPQVSTGGERRLVPPSGLEFDKKNKRLQYIGKVERKLVMMQLYGRLYKEDFYGHHLSCGCGESAETERDMEELERVLQRGYEWDDEWSEKDDHEAPLLPRSSSLFKHSVLDDEDIGDGALM